MSSQPGENDGRSVLSWKSVLDAADAHEAECLPTSGQPLTAPPGPDAPARDDIELAIAPLSVDPLSFDPLPPIVESPESLPVAEASTASAVVIGDVHLEVPPLDLSAPTPATAPAPVPGPRIEPLLPTGSVQADVVPIGVAPATPGVSVATEVSGSATPVLDTVDLKIAPLDVAQSPLTGELAAVVAADRQQPSPSPEAVPSTTPTPAPAPALSPSLAAPAFVPAVPPAPALSPAPAPAPAPAPGPALSPAPTPAPHAAHGAMGSAAPAPAAVSDPTVAIGLPSNAVAPDALPTTVIAEAGVAQVPPPAMVGGGLAAQLLNGVPVTGGPAVLSNQANQAMLPAVAQTAPPAPLPAAVKVDRKDRRHDKKLKKHQQKQALEAAKAKSKAHRSGGGGVALFFTLIVLAGLIAGAVVFGRPYLFPDDWDADARPYGEAVEAARGAEIDEPLVVQRRQADVFAASMAVHVLGPWQNELPTWRSLGLASGAIDAPSLGALVADWTVAYYSPTTREVVVNDAAPVLSTDAAITEAMAAGALDDETAWSSAIEETLLDEAALTRAAVTASSRAVAGATVFGAARQSQREISVSTYLPPVLEYRVNAADVYAEFGPDNAAGLDAIGAASRLTISTEPQLIDGDVLIAAQQPTDRTLWYLVFASYTDSATAYAASNALVQASIATTDAAGTQCTYGTFSGIDVAGVARVSDTLQQWAANAPAAFQASFTTLPNGSLQLRSCDPGIGFESAARFGVGREIARLRSVELAAVSGVAPGAGAPVNRAALIDEVRASAIGLAMLDLDFAATPEESAAEARAIVAAVPSDPTAGE